VKEVGHSKSGKKQRLDHSFKNEGDFMAEREGEGRTNVCCSVVSNGMGVEEKKKWSPPTTKIETKKKTNARRLNPKREGRDYRKG